MSCRTKPCGCNDVGLTTQSACGHVDCPNPEQCAETFSGECIVYTGDTIIDANIQYGDRFNEIVQKLVLMFTNPMCIDPTSSCQSPIGLMSTAITTTAVTVKWLPAPGAISYNLEYKQPSDLSWMVIGPILPVPTPMQTIINLIPNTDYLIRVTSNCASTTCTSLTIQVKTKIIII